MSDVFHLRPMEPAVTPADVRAMADDADGCFNLHKVNWNQSFLASGGQRMLCWYSAPDAESARLALQELGSDTISVWAGRIHDAPGADAPLPDEANVVVERNWDEPVSLEEIQAIEDAGAWCLDTHRVTFVRTFFSYDRKHMICLYRAPDAESVRLAQREAEMPVDRVWAFQPVRPASA